MTILAVDGHNQRLAHLVKCLKAVYPSENISGFTDPMLAVKYSTQHEVDTVFTIINMRRMDGYMLAAGIRRWQENVKIYYIAEESEPVKDTDSCGQLTCPITVEAVENLVGIRQTKLQSI